MPTLNAPIIGLAGRARVGKDTVADFILAQAPHGYKHSFADPIRQMLRPLGIDMSVPFWQERKEEIIPVLGVSPRRLMQTLGTDWGRNLIHPDLWLIIAQQQLLLYGPGMVITDVRFENEATWIRERGGKIIHVFRPNAPAVEEHASEQGVAVLPNEDIQLFNEGTREELQSAVLELLHVYET